MTRSCHQRRLYSLMSAWTSRDFRIARKFATTSWYTAAGDSKATSRREGAGVVEDLVVCLAGRRVLLLHPEGVDLGFEVPHLSVVEHRCENERPGRLRALWASEDVDRFRDETAAAHVARLGLRIAVLDVALFI